MELIETKELMEELIRRSDGCVIAFVEKGHPSKAGTEFVYGNGTLRELIGISAMLTDHIIGECYE